MEELVANFTLEETELDAEFEVEETDKIDALFQIDANVSKVSELENDLNFQTKEEVDEAIEEAIEGVTVDIRGSELIGVETENKVTTITSKTFVFEQGIPATEWVINHNLNKRPSVHLVDSTGREFEAVKSYTSNNQVVISLEAATTGFAYLN
ncbi:MAG: hypothetical protein II234_00615 [Clostridia bacterium]|nr:hypothetical protein [Clostridia bacterium]MBQ5900871.1 hypothetical protein [Clostridia bacterium]